MTESNPRTCEYCGEIIPITMKNRTYYDRIRFCGNSCSNYMRRSTSHLKVDKGTRLIGYDLNAEGCFNMIQAAICECYNDVFILPGEQSKANLDKNYVYKRLLSRRKFLLSKLVGIYCGLSVVDQQVMVRQFDKKYCHLL